MKTITTLLIIVVAGIIGCGKINVNNGSNVTKFPGDVITVSPDNGDSSKVIIENNSEIELQSYANQSVVPSGIFNQATITPPSKSGKKLNASGMDFFGNLLFISYKGLDHKVSGTINIVDVSNKTNPILESSYTSLDYQFNDVKYKSNYLFVVAEKLVNSDAALIVLDISNPNNPVSVFVYSFPNTRPTNLDLLEDELLVSTTNGMYKFSVVDPRTPTLIYSKSQNMFFGAMSVLYNVLLTSVSNTFLSISLNSSTIADMSINSQREDQSRMSRQNSIVYLNNIDKKLTVVDISQTLKLKPMETLFDLTTYGDAHGIAHDQQKIYLAQGTEGALVVDASIPNNPVLKGKMLFSAPTEDTDNVWINSKTNFKFIFINDKENGLRILTQDYVNIPSDKVSIFARGENNAAESSMVLVKINNLNIQTLTLDNTAFQMIEVPYSRTLNSLDKVEVVLLNPQGTQSAYVAFINVNGHYCYQPSKNGTDNTGLFTQLQTISATQSTCDTYLSSPNCAAGTPQSPAQSCNLNNNKLGQMTCDVNGIDYTCVDTGQCQTGFVNVAGSCIPQICTPNVATDCSDGISTRSKTCDTQGISFGSCDLVSCNSGYTQVGSQCQLQVCSPNNSTSCSVANGTGSKTCSSDGLNFGACTLSSCDSGYYNNSGTCIAQVCSANSTQACSSNHFVGLETCDTQGSTWGACVTSGTCEAGYNLTAGACVPQACTPGDTITCSQNNGTGSKTCDGSGNWSSTCAVSSCDSGYNFSSGTCSVQVCSPNTSSSCSVTNGSGIKTCSSDGLSFGSCTLSSCNSGFAELLGSCEVQICFPNSVVACSSGNGTGSKTCDVSGLSFNSCQINSCNSGFYYSAGTCVAQVCAPNISQACTTNHFVGTQSCNATGSAMSSCSVGNTCEAGYFNNNGVCQVQVCAPNSTNSCAIAHGVGSQTCSTNGSGYDTCSVSSCNSGFYQSTNSCVAQICTPNATYSCSVSNGSGLKTCDNLGSSYGACNMTSCNSGYHNESGVCTSDVVSCSVSNGSGIKSWNGASYSACQANSCNSGYYASGSSCLPQSCSPNSTTSCSMTNGVGIKTCDSQGSSYGSCSPSSCNSGYHSDGSSCQSNTVSCTIANGSATQVWNSGTQTYGTCTVSSCISDAYQSGNSCILYCPNPLLLHVIVLGAHVCI